MNMLGSTLADISTSVFLQPWLRCGQAPPLPADQELRRLLEQAVAPAFAVEGAELWGETRGSPDAALARQVAMYLAHVGCGLSLTDVGRLFARDRTTVAHACERVEDRRESAPFDRALELLEGVLHVLASRPA
jgi:hypothetical protein